MALLFTLFLLPRSRLVFHWSFQSSSQTSMTSQLILYVLINKMRIKKAGLFILQRGQTHLRHRHQFMQCWKSWAKNQQKKTKKNSTTKKKRWPWKSRGPQNNWRHREGAGPHLYRPMRTVSVHRVRACLDLSNGQLANVFPACCPKVVSPLLHC